MKIPKMITSLLSDYFRWLAGGLVALVLVLGYFFVVRPQLSAIQTTNLTERDTVQSQVKDEQEYLSALQASIDKFHRVLPDATIASIDDFLPSKPDFPGLLLTVQNLAASANVQLKNLTLSSGGELAANSSTTTGGAGGSGVANAAAATSLSIRTQDLNIIVAGGTSYDDFKRFLTYIEASRRLFDVTTLGFSVGGTSTQNYSLTIRTYYLP